MLIFVEICIQLYRSEENENQRKYEFIAYCRIDNTTSMANMIDYCAHFCLVGSRCIDLFGFHHASSQYHFTWNYSDRYRQFSSNEYPPTNPVCRYVVSKSANRSDSSNSTRIHTHVYGLSSAFHRWFNNEQDESDYQTRRCLT